jgi:hypothetical protein
MKIIRPQRPKMYTGCKTKEQMELWIKLTTIFLVVQKN